MVSMVPAPRCTAGSTRVADRVRNCRAQDVIPAVVGYRYLKTTEIMKPEPRKVAEVKKL